MKYQYTIHNKSSVYNGFFKIDRYTVSFEGFGGGMFNNILRECSQKGDVVAVLPYDPECDTFLLIEQFRIGMAVRGENPWIAEIVAGFMDVVGEDEQTTAKRELFEETGCHAKALHHLSSYYSSPGGSASKVHLFLAEVDSSEAKTHTGLADEGEDIYVHRIPRDALIQRYQNHEINNATALLAIQQFLLGDWAKRLLA